MLCYKCGSHVPDTQTVCPVCGHRMSSVTIRQVSRSYLRKTLDLSAEVGPFVLEEGVAERYVIHELLGEGPTGFSYHVRDEALGTHVCLKAIHPHLLQTAEEQKRFGIVLRQVARLSHPNLSRVFEVGNAKGWMFYTQQLIEGMSLRRIIDERLLKGSFFSCKEVEPILVQLVHALEVVHQTGAHLNLRPENVFVMPDLLKLADVGLGLAIPREPLVQALRARREDGYFAPEFLEGTEAGSSADVYSLGVIIGEMLAGAFPEKGEPSLSRNNADIPEELEVIYRKTVAENPLARYRSVSEFYRDFSAFYEAHTRQTKKRVSSGVLIPLQEDNTTEGEVTADSLTPRVPSVDDSNVALKDFIPKHVVRILQWSAIALGAFVVAGILLALMSSEPEELTGRNVEGFVQPPPVTPPPGVTQPNEAAPPTEVAPTKPSPADAFPSDDVAPEVLEEPPPAERLEPARAPQRATVPPVAEASRCPEQMQRISAGSFKMGTEKDDAYLSFEDLSATLKEVKGFCIDTYEYPNRPGQLPSVGVSWARAQELCQKQGKRLCTEAEWEKACRGNKGFRWPYGNAFDSNLCNSAGETGARALAASGKFPRCVSTYAVFDMSGNASEWTEEKVAKGGSFSSSDFGVRCASRKPRASATPEMGFRCCVDLK